MMIIIVSIFISLTPIFVRPWRRISQVSLPYGDT